MTRSPSRRSRPGGRRRKPRRRAEGEGSRPRVSLSAALTVLLLAAVTFGVLRLAGSGASRDWLDSGLQRLSRVVSPQERADPALVALGLRSATKDALVQLGVAEEQLSARGGEPEGFGSGPVFWEAPLPPGVDIETANLVISRAARAAGGAVLDGVERNRRRGKGRSLSLLLAAGADSAPCVELLLHEMELGRAAREPSGARLAIVVGELGRELDETARRIMDSPLPLSVAVLPGRAASEETARYACSRGKEVLVHLPIEPVGYPARDPGPGAVLLDQSSREVRRRVRAALKELGCAGGVAAYRGSAGLRDRDLVEAIMKELAEQGLFFLDNGTTAHSIAGEAAERYGVSFMKNDLFLTSERGDSNLLSRRLERAEQLALRRGRAIVMARGDARLLELLASRAGEYESKGLELVKVSELLGGR